MQIDPKTIQFSVVINVEQAGVVLEALSALPYKQVGGLIDGLRSVALQAIQSAEAAAAETAVAAAANGDAAVEPDVADAGPSAEGEAVK